jgi:hypothetical protein
MAKIKGEIDPYWHESYLIILILNKGLISKDELFKKIRQEQKRRTVLGEKETAHSKSAYHYWLKARKKEWVVSECENTLELTPLGKWIANSKLGTLFDRDDFVVNFVCPKCTRPAHLVLLKPLPDTAETNAKGRLFMRVDCPRCEYSVERQGISEALSKGEFMDFYKKALTELQKLGESGVKVFSE